MRRGGCCGYGRCRLGRAQARRGAHGTDASARGAAWRPRRGAPASLRSSSASATRPPLTWPRRCPPDLPRLGRDERMRASSCAEPVERAGVAAMHGGGVHLYAGVDQSYQMPIGSKFGHPRSAQARVERGGRERACGRVGRRRWSAPSREANPMMICSRLPVLATCARTW